MRALIVGTGSAGMRHLNNIISLGHDVICVENDDTKYNELKKKYPTYKTIPEALKEDFDFAVIATPTQLHVSQATYLASAGKHVFIEKPLSYDMDGIETLVNTAKSKNVKLMTACNLRFSSGVFLVKTLLNNNAIGKPLTVDYFFSYDLRKWRPEQDYVKSYSSGHHGGIALDDVHAIDLLLYLFGDVNNIKGSLHKTGMLQIENEDIADYVLEFKNGMIGHIHSDYLSEVYLRNMQIVGERGVIQLDLAEGRVYLHTDVMEEWRVFITQEDKNEMYLHEIEYYIDCIINNKEPMTNGIRPLELIMQLKEQNK